MLTKFLNFAIAHMPLDYFGSNLFNVEVPMVAVYFGNATFFLQHSFLLVAGFWPL